jgi:hypothetical protein
MNYIHRRDGTIAYSLGCIVPRDNADVGTIYNYLQQ